MGYIHSIETMGLVDGPGIRVVIFMQGCPLRCKFCHNPDTWNKNIEKEVTSEELVKIINNYKPYFKKNGGVTFSGGEPLLQSEFLKETLKLAKENNINTCVDTSGTGYDINLLDEIFDYTDLFLVDIKAVKDIDYKEMTGSDIAEFNYFKEKLNKKNKPIWIRQVIVPGINDTKEYILELKEYIKTFKNVLKVELLPYKDLGKSKYEKLGINYILKDIKPLANKKLAELNNILNEK